MAYAANKDRADRIFGQTFEDVWWQRPSASTMKRISTGDVFNYAAYNGGYSSYFGLLHGGQLLQGDVKVLAVNAHSSEPIYVVGPALVQIGASRGTKRSWTDEELHLIASFFQTASQIMHVDDIASLRANGHHEMADANERLPMQKVSIVVDY